MWTPNFVEYWIICLAAWELGAAVMPVNCLIQEDKLVDQLTGTGAAYLVCDQVNLADAIALRNKVASLNKIIVMDQVSMNREQGSFLSYFIFYNFAKAQLLM